LGYGLLNRGINDPRYAVILNPARQPIIQDILRHLGFDFGVADEKHHGKKSNVYPDLVGTGKSKVSNRIAGAIN
jgi:hypothetical protein